MKFLIKPRMTYNEMRNWLDYHESSSVLPVPTIDDFAKQEGYLYCFECYHYVIGAFIPNKDGDMMICYICKNMENEA